MDTEKLMSFTVRTDILERVQALKELIDQFVNDYTKRARPHKSGRGYEVFFSSKQYEEIKSIFTRMDNLKRDLSHKEAVNVEEWIELIKFMQRFPSLFSLEGFSFMKFYVSSTGALTSFKNELVTFVSKGNYDLNKSSVEYAEKLKNLSAKERLKQDLKLHNISLDFSIDSIDESKFEDYILFEMISEKFELSVSGMSEDSAKLIVEHELGGYDMIDADNLQDEIQERGIDELFDGEALFCQPLIDGIEKIQIASKNNPLFKLTFEEQNGLNIKNLNKSLGAILLEKIENDKYEMIYYHLAATPANHTGVLLINKLVTKQDIMSNLEFIISDGIYLGLKYHDQEVIFDYGNEYKFDYIESGLWTIHELKNLETDKVI